MNKTKPYQIAAGPYLKHAKELQHTPVLAEKKVDADLPQDHVYDIGRHP